MKNKGLTSRELLREFEKKFDQLSMGEQQSLRSEKVELFVQAADSRLQKSLVQLLEDPAGELDSHEDFEENDIVEKIVEKPKASSSPTLEGKEKPKATQSYTLDDSTIDELIKASCITNGGSRKGHKFHSTTAGDSIPETTGWTDPIDSLSMYAYIAKAQANEAFVEDKRKREDEAPETSKRQTRANTRSDGERMQKSTPISEVQMKDASKDKKQSKVRGPSYKLRSDIELTTNLKKVFEERILNSKVEMTLGDILGIAKREFHEEIIDIIKRKRHVPVEQETNPTSIQNILHEELEDLEEPRARMENDVVLEAKHAHFHEDEESDEVPRSHFLRSHWARATTETVVKITDFEEPILALVDCGSEINLMSMTLYQKGKWPIDLDHGWRIRAANTQPGFLYGACANLKVTIGDVSDEQNFFVQDHSSYSLILGQPYIVALRMETKVLDDGSAYARVRSKDGKKAVQFMTVCVNHARNKEGLRDHPLPKIQKDFKENRKFGELHKWEKQYVSHFQSEMQGCAVLDPNDVISGIFEDVSHIDTIADLEARLKNKDLFDKNHRLRPHAIQEGDWVLVYDSSLDNQYMAMRKMVKRWFGPYAILHVYPNATYKLCELDGTDKFYRQKEDFRFIYKVKRRKILDSLTSSVRRQ
ncbi:hypothetical protein L7F22_041994 [Adiantum nelumboides]|nr:hypothetical protein [Adiantum nelumboides]